MQPKVSIVIPCYNKEKYIGRMLDSILAQKWGNIELILVNDGSTDSTGEIIAAYKQKAVAKGYEVVIVDQVNRGVAAAVKSGLMRACGTFICQVDADDELDSAYVSTMVDFLWTHPDYEWAACDALVMDNDETSYRSHFNILDFELREWKNIAERYFFFEMHDTVWGYMVRTDYLKKCRVIENYYCDIPITQEPQFVVPLVANKGKLKHIPMPLYHYFVNPDSIMTNVRTYADVERFRNQYHMIIRKTIEGLFVNSTEKRRLHTISELSHHIRTWGIMSVHGEQKTKKAAQLNEAFIALVNSAFIPSPRLTTAQLDKRDLLITAIKDNIMSQHFQPPPTGHIIAWGAMGRRGKYLLPLLQGTALEPTELWDIVGDGTTIKQPNVSSLTKDDTVLVLPANTAAAGIRDKLQHTRCTLLFANNVFSHIASLQFPQFYDGSITFVPDASS